MNRRTRNWKIAAGLFLPVFWGWISLVFLGFLSLWADSSSWLIWTPIVVAWLALIPVTGFTQGVLSVILWHGADLTPEEHRKWSNWSLFLFYLPFLPWLIIATLWTCGLALFPAILHVSLYRSGQTRGQTWIDEHRFEEFFDLKPRSQADDASSTKP